MDKVLNLYKNAGETPLECILRFKKDNPEYENVKMTYAGRLDPLAEGALIVLAGEAVHRKEEFLNLKKEYEVEVLFGFETDTYDVMGAVQDKRTLSRQKFFWARKFFAKNFLRPSPLLPRPIKTSALNEFCYPSIDTVNVEEVLKKFIGKNVFEYPAYSSKPVNGKPLFSLARSGDLDDIEMPKREVEIYNLEILSWREINSKDLLGDIINKIEKVNGDFRQEIILSKWKEVLEKTDINFQIVKIRAEVSSGTYMRTLAYEWGKALGVPALAYHIVRTKVG